MIRNPVIRSLLHGVPAAAPIVERIVLVVIGGYMLVAGLAALGARVATLWLEPSEAVLLFSLLAFPAYLAVMLAGFASASRGLPRWGIGFTGLAVFVVSVAAP